MCVTAVLLCVTPVCTESGKRKRQNGMQGKERVAMKLLSFPMLGNRALATVPAQYTSDLQPISGAAMLLQYSAVKRAARVSQTDSSIKV